MQGNPSVESRKKPESPDASRDEASSSPLIQESINGVAAELTQQAMDNERLEKMPEPVEKVSGEVIFLSSEPWQGHDIKPYPSSHSSMCFGALSLHAVKFGVTFR